MSLLENASEGSLSTGAGDREPDRGRRRILLVEDNDADRDVYGGLLWYNGYHVLHAENGEEALALAAEARPDLILLDVMLPGELSGLDVAARVRDQGVNVPIDPFHVVREVMRRVGAAQGGDR